MPSSIRRWSPNLLPRLPSSDGITDSTAAQNSSEITPIRVTGQSSLVNAFPFGRHALGERYRRLVKRRGRLKALVAVARSILVIAWQLLSDPTARFHDLGPDYHTSRVVTERKIRNHIAHLTAMGFHVTLQPAA